MKKNINNTNIMKREILALWRAQAQAQPQPCPQRVSCDSTSQSDSSMENLAVWTQIWCWLAKRICVLWGKPNDLGQCLNLWFSALPRDCKPRYAEEGYSSKKITKTFFFNEGEKKWRKTSIIPISWWSVKKICIHVCVWDIQGNFKALISLCKQTKGYANFGLCSLHLLRHILVTARSQCTL